MEVSLPVFIMEKPHTGCVIIHFSIKYNAFGWEIHPDHGPDRPAPKMAWIKLELLYRQASEKLIDKIQPQQVLAAGDVGVLGFYTNAPILDTVGFKFNTVFKILSN